MMWQDLVFLAGSVLSIVFLAPTIRDVTAQVPLGSSVPSMTIGAVYAITYATMGMTFSAVGSIGVATMWSLIACYRSPGPHTGPAHVARYPVELVQQYRHLVIGARAEDQPAQSDHQPAD